MTGLLVLDESRMDPGELTGKTGTTPRTLGKGTTGTGRLRVEGDGRGRGRGRQEVVERETRTTRSTILIHGFKEKLKRVVLFPFFKKYHYLYRNFDRNFIVISFGENVDSCSV